MLPEAATLTDLLVRAQRGGPQAWNEALPIVYHDLKQIAAAHFRQKRSSHILQPTALVHEAWLKLIRTPGIGFQSRIHFFSFCSRLMRQILVDQARRRKLEGQPAPALSDSVETLDLDEALLELEKLSPRQCRVVEMRYFGGMSIEEIADALDCSSRTIKRDWLAARTWLYQHLQSR
jgi:RNA polymerase sigma factor (TIGR02999 family)